MLDNMYEKRTVIIYACDCECFAKKSVCHMISTSLELSAFKLPIQKFNSMEASMESFSSPHSPLLVMGQISLTVWSMRKIFGQCFSFLFSNFLMVFQSFTQLFLQAPLPKPKIRIQKTLSITIPHRYLSWTAGWRRV